jgi:hypothetical protein
MLAKYVMAVDFLGQPLNWHVCHGTGLWFITMAVLNLITFGDTYQEIKHNRIWYQI